MAKAARKPSSFVPPLRQGHYWARSDEEKATFFRQHLEQTFAPYNIFTTVIPNLQLEEAERISHISPKEIGHIVTRLNRHKAPGHDQISVKMLQQLPKKGACRPSQISLPQLLENSQYHNDSQGRQVSSRSFFI